MLHYFKKVLICTTTFVFFSAAKANLSHDLHHLQQAYPGTFEISLDEQYLIWKNGVKMPVSDNRPNKTLAEKINNPCLADQISNVYYPLEKIDLNAVFEKKEDPGRIRYEPFFKEMYGHNEQEVRAHLTTIAWMPNTFKNSDGTPHYQIQVTTINEVDRKLKNISEELDALVKKHPEYIAYLDLGANGGTFKWRTIAHTNRISNHSFGMTMDINPNEPYTNYWQQDLPKNKILDLQAQENNELTQYHNQVPWPIVLIFEKYKFIWGGKWYHYDSMHFEYRPELV